MKEIAMLRGAEPRKILQTVIKKKVPVTMSYSSGGKRHTAKVLLTNLGANRLDVQFSPGEIKKTHSLNLRANQPVGISLKHGYAKFAFETTVVGLEPSSEHLAENIRRKGPTIVVVVPDRIEIIQKRNFFRVSVPCSLKVNVTMWCDCHMDKKPKAPRMQTRNQDAHWASPEHIWQGKLIDISIGGMQIVVDTKQKPNLKKGQFISLRFTPMPYETPLMLNARIRTILETADKKSICLGLQIVCSKAGQPDQQTLQRLCNVAEHYHQINQYSTRQQDFQTTSPPR